MAVGTLVFKTFMSYISYFNLHNRILWLLALVSTGTDVIFGLLCFMAVGEYATVMSSFPALSANSSMQTGYGWGLYVLTGLCAWIGAIMSGWIVVKGTGENSTVSKAQINH